MRESWTLEICGDVAEGGLLIGIRQVMSLIARAVKTTRDADLGLHLAEHTDVGSTDVHFYGDLVVSSWLARLGRSVAGGLAGFVTRTELDRFIRHQGLTVVQEATPGELRSRVAEADNMTPDWPERVSACYAALVVIASGELLQTGDPPQA